MKPVRLFLLLLGVAATLGMCRAAEPEKLQWYEIVIQSGQSVERFVGSSTVSVNELELELRRGDTITLENLRALENRGEGPRWWPIREGETLKIRPSVVLYYFVLPKDPKS